jgi:hypothetical protein
MRSCALLAETQHSCKRQADVNWLLPTLRRVRFIRLRRQPAGWKGMRWQSPRGMLSIDPETRDVVQTVYIRRVERVGGELRTSIRQDGGCDDCRDSTSTAFNRPPGHHRRPNILNGPI